MQEIVRNYLGKSFFFFMVVAVIAIIIVIIIYWMMIRLTVRAELVLASASPWLSSSSLLGQIRPARPSEPLTLRLQRSAQIWEVMIRDRHTHKHCIIIYIIIIIITTCKTDHQSRARPRRRPGCQKGSLRMRMMRKMMMVVVVVMIVMRRRLIFVSLFVLLLQNISSAFQTKHPSTATKHPLLFKAQI